MKVQEVMAKELSTCRADEALTTAARVMWERDIGAVPIVGAEGKLVGIITDRDICMAAYFTGESLPSMLISEHMSKEVFTAEPGQNIESAEELMRSKQVRRLPVLDDARALVGMVTLGDVARAAAARGRKGVAVEDVAATLAAVSQPRPAPTQATA